MTWVATGVTVATTVGTAAYSASQAGKGGGGVSKSDRREMKSWGGAAVGALAQDRASRLTREQQLMELEGLLGTDAQVRGELGGDPRLAQYSQRYQVDFGIAKGGANQQWNQWARKAGVGKDANSGLSNVQKGANQILDQAEAAAQRGDFAAAEQLRQQAADYVGMRSPTGALSSVYRSAMSLGGGTSEGARALASSPSAQIVGGLVRDARGLLDRDSDVYNRFYDSLTSGAIASVESELEQGERALGAEARGIELAASEREAALGGVRDPFASIAMRQRARESVAGERADLHSQAGAEIAGIKSSAKQWLEEYSRTFAAGTAAFAREWATGAPGIRETFQNALTSLAQMTAQVATQMSGQYADLTQLGETLQANRDNQWMSLAAGALGTGLGMLGNTTGTKPGGGPGGGRGNVVDRGSAQWNLGDVNTSGPSVLAALGGAMRAAMS